MTTCWIPHSQFTKSEARAFLADGSLPENFRERVELVLELECSNCDDRLCMNCVLRVMHDTCVYDCPFCCDQSARAANTRFSHEGDDRD
jgi:hypothetical protein